MTLPSLNQWHHVAVVFDGSFTYSNAGLQNAGMLKVYLNGDLQSLTFSGNIPANTPGNTSSALSTNKTLVLANGSWVTTVASSSWNGKISQMCIFTYNLSQEQVTYLYNLNNPMVISGGEPIAYYPLGDNSNPNATACYPNISVGADSVFNFAPDSFINCGDINSVNSDGESAFSISCWFKSTSTSGGSLVTKSKNSANFDGYQLWLDATGEVRFYLGSYTGTANTSPWVYVKSANQFNNGEWHNAVVTYNANQSTSGIKLYIDNVEQVLSVYNNAPSVSSSVQNDFIIGARGNSSANGFYYTGEISNVQFWDAKLEA